jgi:putative FmdB family regulatory protein
VPTYVYACKSCGEQFEVIQKMSDAALKECRTCPGEVRRVIFPPAVVYKGTGFYVTDYKNGGRKSDSESGAASSSESSSTSSDTKSEAKSDTKSEAKSETKSDSSSTTKTEPKAST